MTRILSSSLKPNSRLSVGDMSSKSSQQSFFSVSSLPPFLPCFIVMYCFEVEVLNWPWYLLYTFGKSWTLILLNVEITGICYLCPAMFSFLLIYFVILYMVFLENCPLHKENVDPGDARLCVLKHMLPYWFSCLNLASVTPEVLKSPVITVLQSVPVFCFINRYFSHMNLLQCWVQMYLICTLYYSCWSLSQAMVKKKGGTSISPSYSLSTPQSE